MKKSALASTSCALVIVTNVLLIVRVLPSIQADPASYALSYALIALSAYLIYRTSSART